MRATINLRRGQIGGRETVLRQVLLRKINPAHGDVFFDVANDVRQLKRQTAAFGQRLGGGIAISKDLDAHQSNHRRHSIAILAQLFKRLVTRDQRRTGRRHWLARDRDPQPYRRRAGREAQWESGMCAAHRSAPAAPDHPWAVPPMRGGLYRAIPPACCAILGAERVVVSDVVAAPHEGVHRAQRIPFPSRKHQQTRNRNSWRRSGRYSGRRSTPFRAGKRSEQIARAHFPRRCSSQFPQRGTSHQAPVSASSKLRDAGPARRNVWRSIAFRISCPPRLNSSMSMASSRLTFATQRQPLRKPFPRALDFKLDHLAERGSVFAIPNLFFAHAETAQIFEWKINSSFGKVRAHVLPEVRELQRGASVVGKLLPLGIAVSAEIQHQVAHRIRRIAAVAQQIVERFVAGDALILPERGQQVRKFMLRNFKLAHGLGERDKYGMPGMPVIARISSASHWSSNCKDAAAVAHLVAQIVRDAAIRIDVEEVLAQLCRKKPDATEKFS